MDVTWYPPAEGYVKINIHSTERQLPLPNGNVNGLGVIIRDVEGKMLWGGMGPIPNYGLLLTQLKGMHTAAVKAHQLGKPKTHIETDNQWVYEAIRDQDEIIFDEETEKILRQLNTLYANNYKIGISDRKVSCTIPEMNTVAIYLAEYGMEHLNVFSEITEAFGNLQILMDEDMGMGVHLSMPFIHSFLGLGEVVDASPPAPHIHAHKWAKQDGTSRATELGDINFELHHNDNTGIKKMAEGTSRLTAEGGNVARSKGKEKVLAGYKFNENGALSKEAIDLLDKGSLAFISKGIKKNVIDLEEKICEGVYMKDVLESAVGGTLEETVKKIAEIRISSKGVVIDNGQKVDQQVFVGDMLEEEQEMLDMFNYDALVQEMEK